MASAKDLFNKLGNSGGGFKPVPKPTVVPTSVDPKADAKAVGGGHKATEALKNKQGGSGGGGGGGGASVPIGVRPKV